MYLDFTVFWYFVVIRDYQWMSARGEDNRGYDPFNAHPCEGPQQIKPHDTPRQGITVLQVKQKGGWISCT